MLMHVPTSKAGFSKLAPLDVFWAITAPIAALALRDPNLLDAGDLMEGIPAGYEYVLVTISAQSRPSCCSASAME